MFVVAKASLDSTLRQEPRDKQLQLPFGETWWKSDEMAWGVVTFELEQMLTSHSIPPGHCYKFSLHWETAHCLAAVF